MMLSASLWHSGFCLVSLLDTRVSLAVTSPNVVAELNNSARTDNRLSSGWEKRAGRSSLVGAFRLTPSWRRRSIEDTEIRKSKGEKEQRALRRGVNRSIREGEVIPTYVGT